VLGVVVDGMVAVVGLIAVVMVDVSVEPREAETVTLPGGLLSMRTVSVVGELTAVAVKMLVAVAGVEEVLLFEVIVKILVDAVVVEVLVVEIVVVVVVVVFVGVIVVVWAVVVGVGLLVVVGVLVVGEVVVGIRVVVVLVVVGVVHSKYRYVS